MVRAERVTGSRRWRWNTNTWHYASWNEYARRNFFWVGWNFFFGTACLGWGIWYLTQLSWWAAYFLLIGAWNVANVTIFPQRSMARHRAHDAEWVDQYMAQGMPRETATLVSNLICEGQPAVAARLAHSWVLRQLPPGAYDL